jgi:hypothetical protein
MNIELDAREQNFKLRPKASLHEGRGLRALPTKGRAAPRPANVNDRGRQCYGLLAFSQFNI